MGTRACVYLRLTGQMLANRGEVCDRFLKAQGESWRASEMQKGALRSPPRDATP
jgi:hypothetical protein